MPEEIFEQINKTRKDSSLRADISQPIADSSEPKIIIHTMPKKFIALRPVSSQAKSTGILILVFGSLLLVASLAVFYFYFFKSKPPAVVEETAPVSKDETALSPETEPSAGTNREPAVNQNNANIIGGETITGDTATSTPLSEEATTTNFISPETATTTVENNIATTTTLVATSTDAAKGSPDGDSDGLSDMEETMLDTNPAAPDTDGDNYGDLAELLSLYNPAGNGKIIVNPNIEKYTNTLYNYSVYYPKNWIFKTLTGADSVIWQADNGQFVQIIVQTNIEKLNIEDWYKKQLNTSFIRSEQIVYKSGWTGVKSEDGLTYYLANPLSDSIFTVTYNLGVSNTLYYKNIFEMMIKSLEIKE